MGERILVVDDDREIVKAVDILLKKEGYEVLKAYDGLQALDILSRESVRLVLIDVMMPKLDGLSALMRIRRTRCWDCLWAPTIMWQSPTILRSWQPG